MPAMRLRARERTAYDWTLVDQIKNVNRVRAAANYAKYLALWKAWYVGYAALPGVPTRCIPTIIPDRYFRCMLVVL